MSGFQFWLSTGPVWLIGLILFLVMVAAAVGGHWFRRSRERSGASEDDKEEAGYVVSSVLGLLALLMGFTFSLAVDRYETRRGMVLEEANAIGTAYLRAQLLPEPDRARTSDILVRYTENRVVLAKAPTAERLKINDDLTTDLWAATSAAFDKIKGLDFSSTYVESINTVIDLSTSRKAARMVRVPVGVFVVLLVYLVVAAAVMGYVLHGKTGRRSAIFLMALMTLSLMLILDIDRPGRGLTREGQGPMEWLLTSLKATPPTTYDRWKTPEAPTTLPPPVKPLGARP